MAQLRDHIERQLRTLDLSPRRRFSTISNNFIDSLAFKDLECLEGNGVVVDRLGGLIGDRTTHFHGNGLHPGFNISFG